ncbi:MAG: hypothetical protein JSC188_000630 [Candidatus Tokpelaia sp. JSC188]|nr:MAG: hypothetical protein JSC188_000630 [Candidatus Tokpelaia sp. JSC188]
MRPQQNRRTRGRVNNNRRSPNPLTRNYESNGPDVKIRGNAQHIADKYATLARDSQASGDRIMAENYLQHAEHYMRIILSAQSQLAQAVIRDDATDDSDSTNLLKSSDGENLANNKQRDVTDDMPTEITFSAAFDNEFSSESEEKNIINRSRRPTRRRLSRKKELSCCTTSEEQTESVGTDIVEQDDTTTTNDKSYSESKKDSLLPCRKSV